MYKTPNFPCNEIRCWSDWTNILCSLVSLGSRIQMKYIGLEMLGTSLPCLWNAQSCLMEETCGCETREITLEFECLYFNLSDNIPALSYSGAQAHQGKRAKHFILTPFSRID